MNGTTFAWRPKPLVTATLCSTEKRLAIASASSFTLAFLSGVVANRFLAR